MDLRKNEKEAAERERGQNRLTGLYLHLISVAAVVQCVKFNVLRITVAEVDSDQIFKITSHAVKLK